MSDVVRGTAEERLGIRVRRAREAMGWTQAELARRLADVGVSLHASAIAKIEGASRAIRVNEAAALASILGRPLDELVHAPEDEWQEVLDVLTDALRLHRDAEKRQSEAFDIMRTLRADFQDDAPLPTAAPDLQPHLLRVLAALAPYSPTKTDG